MGNNKIRSIIKMLPVAAVILIIPFIVVLNIGTTGLSDFQWFSADGTEVDFFLIGKVTALLIVGILMVAMLLYRLIFNGKMVRFPLIALAPAVIYVILTVISSLKNKGRADLITGGFSSHQSVAVVVTYFIIFAYTYTVLTGRKRKKFVYYTTLFFVIQGFVMGIIGTLQAIGYDPMLTDFSRKLITAFSNIDPERVNISFPEHTVYLTFYNPDYVGTYVSLMIPVMAAGFILTRNILIRIMAVLSSLMLIISLIMSGSLAGIIATVVSCVIGVVIFLFFYFEKKYQRILLSAGCALFVVGVLVAGGLYIVNYADENTPALSSINVSDEYVTVMINDNEFNITYDTKDGIKTYDKDLKQVLLITEDNGIYKSNDFAIQTGASAEGRVGFNVLVDDKAYFFTNMDEAGNEGTYLYRNVFGRYTSELTTAQIWEPFKKKQELFNHRGYIWGYSLPLMKQHLLRGCGQDNFIYEFPNDDYPANVNNGYTGQIVTKPHNMYLQMAVENGLVAMIAWILIYVMYFIYTLMSAKAAGFVTRYTIVSMTFFAGVTGYMIAGMANDSTVCVAPIMWVVCGLGFAYNKMIIDKEKKGNGTN